MKFIINYFGWFWLGFSLSLFGNMHFYTWQFYVIIVPTIILVKLYEHIYGNE